MEDTAKVVGLAIGGALTVLGGLFLLVILGTLVGGVIGWCVGLLFSGTILGILAQIGITGVTMFQVGAFLGFVSGFFRAVRK